MVKLSFYIFNCYTIVMKDLNKRKVNIKKLLNYGFIKKINSYYYEDILLKDQFKIIVTYENNILDSKVIDLKTNEEYFLVKIKDITGEYVGKIRELYLNKIDEIIDKCFDKEIFKYKQTKDIVKYIEKTYNVKPEFLWDDDCNSALRCPDNLKWFGIIMTVTKDKLGFKSHDLIEIIDLKIDADEIKKLVDNKNYFPGYHMNKKYWLTIILDNSINNEVIFKLIDKSYNLVKKN